MELMSQGDIYNGNVATEKLVNDFNYVTGLARGLNSDIERGISGTPADLAERRALYGGN